ncbi:hypothetical protein [Halomicrococcus sp. SG-WS-1]|uniref:hypothetical protein n=1 Tax=Halomicrococcus sp. SG-WS-1 TaxID=3439057 RepID=UPI003F7A60FB
MSDKIDGLYEDATPDIESGEIQIDGHPIRYLLYGYEIDTLHNLFPIFITHDAGQGLDKLQKLIVKSVNRNTAFSVCAPGKYTPPPVQNENTDCHIEFVRITPETDPTLIDDVSEAQAIRLANDYKTKLEDGNNPYLNSGGTDDSKFVKFFLDIGRGHCVQLPFPTSKPSENEEDEQLQTVLPCYIITVEDPNRRGQELPEKELVTLRWTYSLVE